MERYVDYLFGTGYTILISKYIPVDAILDRRKKVLIINTDRIKETEIVLCSRSTFVQQNGEKI